MENLVLKYCQIFLLKNKNVIINKTKKKTKKKFQFKIQLAF